MDGRWRRRPASRRGRREEWRIGNEKDTQLGMNRIQLKVRGLLSSDFTYIQDAEVLTGLLTAAVRGCMEGACEFSTYVASVADRDCSSLEASACAWTARSC